MVFSCCFALYSMYLTRRVVCCDLASLPPQANACLLDLESDVLLLPEELPQFPSRQELVLELTETLARFNVHTQHLDR